MGPLAIRVIEGLKRHTVTLSENDSGLRFELEFNATLNPHEEAGHLRRRVGRITEHMYRAQQMGRYTGWLEFEGRRMAVDGWPGQRDHSWGVRAEMRSDETAPPLTFYPPFFYCWATAQFKDHGLVVFFKERAPGDLIYISGEIVQPLGTRASSRHKLATVQHQVTWHDDPHGQSMAAASFDLTFASGERRPIQVRVLPTKYYLKGEWHLLWPMRMTMRLDVLPSLGAWHLQPRVGFGPSLSHSWLDTPGPTADLALSDQREQPLAIIRAGKSSRHPLRPQLQGVLEAQAAWVHVGVAGGLRHEQPDYVVGQ